MKICSTTQYTFLQNLNSVFGNACTAFLKKRSTEIISWALQRITLLAQILYCKNAKMQHVFYAGSVLHFRSNHACNIPFPSLQNIFPSFCSKLFFSKIKIECKQRPPHRLRRRSVPLRGPVVCACQGKPTASRPVSPWILFRRRPTDGAPQNRSVSRWPPLLFWGITCHSSLHFPHHPEHKKHANALPIFTLFHMLFLGEWADMDAGVLY